MRFHPVVLAVGALAFWARIAVAVCGDGVLDLGELCDAGADPSGTCCTNLCTYAPPLTTCRPPTGECDLAEVCTGLTPDCPTNVFRPAEVCRASAGPCDLPETCSGVGPACPADSVAPADVVCRLAAAACDVAEHCSGASVDCPPDSGEPDTDQDGTCDQLDLCPAVADPAQTDSDGDGLGDACDPCTDIDNGRLANTRLALTKLSAPGDDDRLRLKAILTIPDTPAIDPKQNGIRLLLAGSLGLVVDATIPPGPFDTQSRAGWRDDGTERWSYKNGGDPVPSQAGVRKILLRRYKGVAGQWRLVISGRGGDLRAAVGQDSLTFTVVVDTPVASTGQCASVEFITVGTQSDCRLLNSGQRLECRQKD